MPEFVEYVDRHILPTAADACPIGRGDLGSGFQPREGPGKRFVLGDGQHRGPGLLGGLMVLQNSMSYLGSYRVRSLLSQRPGPLSARLLAEIERHEALYPEEPATR